MHHEAISVRSDVGKGSSFIVELPRADRDALPLPALVRSSGSEA